MDPEDDLTGGRPHSPPRGNYPGNTAIPPIALSIRWAGSAVEAIVENLLTAGYGGPNGATAMDLDEIIDTLLKRASERPLNARENAALQRAIRLRAAEGVQRAGLGSSVATVPGPPPGTVIYQGPPRPGDPAFRGPPSPIIDVQRPNEALLRRQEEARNRLTIADVGTLLKGLTPLGYATLVASEAQAIVTGVPSRMDDILRPIDEIFFPGVNRPNTGLALPEFSPTLAGLTFPQLPRSTSVPTPFSGVDFGPGGQGFPVPGVASFERFVADAYHRTPTTAELMALGGVLRNQISPQAAVNTIAESRRLSSAEILQITQALSAYLATTGGKTVTVAFPKQFGAEVQKITKGVYNMTVDGEFAMQFATLAQAKNAAKKMNAILRWAVTRAVAIDLTSWGFGVNKFVADGSNPANRFQPPIVIAS